MSRMKQFKLPDLGEGLTEGEIIKWLVAPGDKVTLNQPIVEVETAKAAVEVPSPYAGVVTTLHHGEGDTVDVGTPIIEFDTDPGAGPVPDGLPVSGADDLSSGAAAGAQARAGGDHPEIGTASPDEPVEPGLIGGPAPGGRTSVLVGYGPKTVVATRRPRKSKAGAAPSAAATAPANGRPATAPTAPSTAPASGRPASAVAPTVAPVHRPNPTAIQAVPPTAVSPEVAVLAKPPVRKLAKDLGVDLRTVTASGPAGTITRADVEAAAAGTVAGTATGAVADPAVPGAFTPAEPRWGASREQRVPIRGVRKHTAAAVSASAYTAPHVTEFLTIDITPTMRLRERVAGMREFDGVRVTPLAFVARALLLAVRRNPMINSSWDEQAQEIVVKEYVNLGIAASTPRGLIVPNIKDAGRLGLRELAVAIAELTETARAGRTTPADLQGGSITITNVGVFGVDTGTPILTPGESAILAFGAVREQPWVHQGEIAIRQVTQLALSFDHRVVDGDLGSRFLSDLGAVLADPSLAAVWG